MRILLLNDRIPPENRGGAGQVVWRLARELAHQGHDVHVIAATDKADFTDTRDGIPTYHLQVQYPERFRAWLSLYNPLINPRLKQLFSEIQPDVINAHNIHQYLTYHSLVIGRQMSIPVVFTSHDVMPFAYHKLTHFINRTRCSVQTSEEYRLPPLFNLKQMRFRYNPLRNLIIRRILERSVQVRTAPSQELCDALAANDLPQFTCIHNGIDVQEFTAPDSVVASLRTRLGLDGCKVILFAGRLTGAKGTSQLLDALLQTTQEVPQARLLVLSSVPIDQQIQGTKYRQLRDQHIVSGGWLSGEELVAAFRLAHVTVVPSIVFDTFPTVNLEAMASRSVVIASCYGGSHEAVVDGDTGYIINPFDVDTFATRLTRLLQDDDLRTNMVARAYDRVVKEFSLERQARRMVEQYQKAITGS